MQQGSAFFHGFGCSENAGEELVFDFDELGGFLGGMGVDGGDGGDGVSFVENLAGSEDIAAEGKESGCRLRRGRRAVRNVRESTAVATATPGNFGFGEVSMRRMRAWAWGLRTTAPWSMPAILKSAP
ncbi:MAG: hypothetical protein R2762_25980 [Bryobacteraceae bacterium]